MGFFVEEPYTAMNKFNSTVLATLLLVYSPLGIGQGQTLIEPEMEIVDLVNLDPRSPREGLHMRSDGLATIRIGRLSTTFTASSTDSIELPLTPVMTSPFLNRIFLNMALGFMPVMEIPAG